MIHYDKIQQKKSSANLYLTNDSQFLKKMNLKNR